MQVGKSASVGGRVIVFRGAGNSPGTHFLGRRLLQKQTFPNLIAAHERLRRTEFPEQIEDFAILEYVCMNGESRGGEKLQGLGIDDAIAVKPFD